MMSGATTHFLSDQLDAYTESWQRDHADALACWELEARLEIAVALFHAIQRIDAEMSRQLAASGLTWDRPAAERLLHFYRLWEAPSAQISRRIGELRTKGFAVNGEDAFRRAVLEARSTLGISLDRLEHSARQAREGTLRPLGEIRDELRHQPDTRR